VAPAPIEEFIMPVGRLLFSGRAGPRPVRISAAGRLRCGDRKDLFSLLPIVLFVISAWCVDPGPSDNA